MHDAPSSVGTDAACFSFLHLTDLHVGQPKEAGRYPNILQALKEDLRLYAGLGWRWDVVFFTGDLAFRGDGAELAVAAARLRELLETIEQATGHLPHFFPVPGNHDLCRPGAEELVRLQEFWKQPGARDRFFSDPVCPLRQAVARMFAPYQRMLEALPLSPSFNPGLLPGEYSSVVCVGGVQIGVVALNTAFLHWSDAQPGSLTLDVRQLQRVSGDRIGLWTDQNHFNVLLTHHPADWLDALGQAHLETEIYQHSRFNLHLFGHMHSGAHHALNGPRGVCHRHLGRALFAAEEDGHARMHGYSMGKLVLEPRATPAVPSSGCAASDPTGTASDRIPAASDRTPAASDRTPAASDRTRASWNKRLEMFPRQAATCSTGWTFGDESTATDHAWSICARLGRIHTPPTPKPDTKAVSWRAPRAPLTHGSAEWRALIDVWIAHPPQILFLSAGVPEPSSFDAAPLFRVPVRRDVILEIVQRVCLEARARGLVVVFGGQPGIVAAVLPERAIVSRELDPWLLFFQHRIFEPLQPELSAALGAMPGVQPVWVEGQRDTSDRTLRAGELLALREAMFSLPPEWYVGAVFVGGKGGITDEFKLFGVSVPGAQRVAIGAGGGAAAELLLSHPGDARGLLDDSAPLHGVGDPLVGAVWKGLGLSR